MNGFEEELKMRQAVMKQRSGLYLSDLVALKQRLIAKYGDPYVKSCIMYYLCICGSHEAYVGKEGTFLDFEGDESFLGLLQEHYQHCQ